jgi:hypothetical protein
MKNISILILVMMITLMSLEELKAQSGVMVDKKNRIRYRYKKYQKFDFEDMKIQGETGSPGDLSIIPRYQTKFKNRLPYRRNFNDKIRLGIERIR